MQVTHSRLAAAIAISLAALAPGVEAAKLDPRLAQQLATAAPTDSLEVIVTFPGDGAPDRGDVARLTALGLGGVTLSSVPIAAVVATPAQVRALAADDSIRSVYWNRPLQYDNAEATELTSVDRLRRDTTLRSTSGLPYTGKGIGVLVNDSGVDGTHPDLTFGDHVVQNVAAQTNLRAQDAMLPITYRENVPNTDLLVGHGTHVAGIIGATGAAGGDSAKFEGVAPGAGIVGYGSGAGLFILDTLGGFDYALANQARYNIRVVSNSFGDRSDTCTDFDPDDPTNVVTKALADRGMVVVFSAGNSGSGECTITGNFKKAPWVVAVASGDKQGRLNDFSSRGAVLGLRGGTAIVDGEVLEWSDQPTITAPGSAIYSARDSLADPTYHSGIDAEYEEIGAAAVYYTKLSGTSMSAPHISGVVALMLEANPNLSWREVKKILADTATNMPAEAGWEAGAGYVNAHAAVRAARGFRQYGETVNANRTFNASAQMSVASNEIVPVSFSPVGTPADVTFTVAPGVALVVAGANVGDNTVAIALTDPNGVRHGSAIALPLLGPSIGVTAPGVPGTWKLSVRGIGSVSGVALDPAGVTNGYALPGTVDVALKQIRVDGYTGLDDVAGHPAAGFIQYAVENRLADGDASGTFRPDAPLTRAELAQYLVMGAGIRQATSTPYIADLSATSSVYGFAAAVSSRGGALRDLRGTQAPVVPLLSDGRFDAARQVTRQDLAYSLVQSLGLEAQAKAHSGDVTVVYDTKRIVLEDQGSIAPALRGYVQYALDAGLLTARFALVSGGFLQPPKLVAYFDPGNAATRAEYAAAATRYVTALGTPEE